MENIISREESEKFFRENGLDKLVIKFFYQSDGFSEWNDESFSRYGEVEFHGKLNFGLKDIHREPFVYMFDGEFKTKDILVCKYGENTIRIGESHHDDMSSLGNEWIQVQDIVFYFNEKLVLDCSYMTRECYDEDSYYLYKLREFHYTKELEDVLRLMSSQIDVVRIKEKQVDKEMFGDGETSGKFTI